jgi:monoamine oxidase
MDSGPFDGNMQRREFLTAAAASALASPAIVAEPTDSKPPRREVDVAIVGAGLAGLTAARELRKASVRVCVIEARNRVGGRTLDHPIGDGNVVEGGGQWVGPSQTQIVELAKDLGVKTFDCPKAGKTVVRIGGERVVVKADEKDESEDLRRVQAKLDALAKDVPLAAPWTAPSARELDAVTVADWLRQNAQEQQTRETIGLEVETELGSPRRTSLLWFLFYIRSAGGLHALNVDAQSMRLQGGPQALSKKMAADLGQDLILDSPVTRIDQSAQGGVEVESKRLHVSAKRVVVAMMPADTRRIEFVPKLLASREALVKAWKGEPAFKVNAVYAKPFWRDEGLSGMAIAEGPVAVAFDNSPLDASRGVLLAFIAPEKLPKEKNERKRTILAAFAALFGNKALEPIGYFETDWSTETWTAGCVSPLPPGVLTQHGRTLREPIGRIHWAGTETSEVWCGYMDGAVRSGRRVAAEVRRAL